MEEAELIERLKEARKKIPKEKDKSVEDCMPHYKKILIAARNGELSINPLETPGGLISDLQNAGLLSNTNYRKLTEPGRKYIEKQIMV